MVMLPEKAGLSLIKTGDETTSSRADVTVWRMVFVSGLILLKPLLFLYIQSIAIIEVNESGIGAKATGMPRLDSFRISVIIKAEMIILVKMTMIHSYGFSLRLR